jgi:hypothetical protein
MRLSLESLLVVTNLLQVRCMYSQHRGRVRNCDSNCYVGLLRWRICAEQYPVRLPVAIDDAETNTSYLQVI